MTQIKMEDIKNLRMQTGAGMMDCKKALEEANGNYDEAIIYSEKLLDRHLSTLNAICWRAQFMQAKGHGKEAIDFIKSVISNNPKNDHLWLTLAELYSNEGEFDKAILMIKRAGLILIENGEENNREKMDFLKAKLKQYQSLAE